MRAGRFWGLDVSFESVNRNFCCMWSFPDSSVVVCCLFFSIFLDAELEALNAD